MVVSENGSCYIWKVESFSMLPHQVGERLISKTFVDDAWEKVDFCLSLYPKGRLSSEDKLGLYLCKIQEDLEINLNFSLTLESTEPSREISRCVQNHVLKSDWGFAGFASANEIRDNKNLYLPEDTLTIRCEVHPIKETSAESNANDKSASKLLRKCCVSRTVISVQRKAMSWPIRNIKERIERREEPSIIVASSSKSSPSLRLSLDFKKFLSEDRIKILLKQTCLSSEVERLFVKCKITVISANRKCQKFEESSHLFELNLDDVWQFPSFITSSMLSSETCLYADDMLFLLCEFAFSRRDSIYHSDSNFGSPFIVESGRKNKIDELSTCLKKIYENGEFCDVELKAGDQTFPYYKVVLCARSPVFSAMFVSNMKEKNLNVDEIPDVDTDTLKRMLEYMLSDDMEEDLSPEDAYKLYMAADKYDVESLKRECAVLLISGLSVENVCNLLSLADAHHDDFLMISVHDFISSHGNEISASTQWKKFMQDNPKLSGEVMHQMWLKQFHL